MSKPKVLIADDHLIVAQGLAALLRDEFDLSGVARDGHELVELARRLNPDVIVADISMPSLNGIDALRQLRKQGVTARAILLTQHKDPHIASEAFRAGASGFLIKQSAGDELVTAIHEALQGRTYLTSLIAKDLITLLLQTPVKQGARSELTPRQREILQLLTEGKTAKEVAAALNISVRTVEGHKYEIMETLGVKSSAELVQHAIRLGLISL
ncbi:MAG TPA: response regulator transcription factor [Bryobacteraceae bacterium]|nr:response regulator transcription factor [Bryobacteraceae bacterium]